MTQSHGINLIFILLFSAVISYGISAWLIKYAATLQLIDIPNHRSSHILPTPRGGGAGIVIGFSIVMFAIWFWQAEPLRIWSMILLGWIVAAIGFYDDIISCSALTRLVFHAFSIMLLLLCMGYRIEYAPSLFSLHIPWLWFGVLFIIGVWLINLYNFMDGIDGLAALEAIYVLAAAAITLLLQKHQTSSILPSMIALLGGCMGFLSWNRPKAKIFMGDVGSGFLGFMLAAMAFYTIIYQQLSVINWLIWLTVFWVDATYTLCVRILTRQRWMSAHRSHVYQILARRWESHLRVDMVILGYNLLWLFPLSLLNNFYSTYSSIWLLAAVLPVLITCIAVKAGINND